MTVRLLPLLALLLGLLPATFANADTLRVAVASNFAPLLSELLPAFESKSGHRVLLSAGASGQHYTQITNGAPFDVFFSADDERPRLLEESGAGVAGSRFTYALGALVLWSREPELVTGDGSVLEKDGFRRLALANPRLAPYGLAASQVLLGLGLWERLQPRLVQGENITQTLQFVQTGNAELGFISRAQWQEIDPDQNGSHWEVPMTLHEPIEQQAILLRDSRAGRELLAFLRSDSSRALILAAGYGLPDAGP